METAESNTSSRTQAWRQSQAQEGKKRIEAHIDQETHEALKDIRSETRESYGDIISRLVNEGGLTAADGSGEARPGSTVTLQIPERDLERLRAEYKDLEGYLSSIAQDKAHGLYLTDDGDF